MNVCSAKGHGMPCADSASPDRELTGEVVVANPCEVQFRSAAPIRVAAHRPTFRDRHDPVGHLAGER